MSARLRVRSLVERAAIRRRKRALGSWRRVISPAISQHSRSDTSGRLLWLDGLRGLAALAVVFFHYFTRYDELFGLRPGFELGLPFGSHGVHLFFIISGFVIYFTLERCRRGLDFVVSRVSRLYPAYWTGILITSVVLIVSDVAVADPNIMQVLANLTMFQRFMHQPNIDSVYWTLIIEMCFYIDMLIIYRLGLLPRIEWVVMGWVAAVAGIHLVLGGAAGEAARGTLESMGYGLSLINVMSLGTYAVFFGTGILFYRIHSDGFNLLRTVSLLVVFGSSFIVNTTYFLGVHIAVAILFVLGRTLLRDLLSGRIFVLLGAMSYSLYLVHENVGFAVIHQLAKLGANPYLGVLVALIVSLGLAYAMMVLIEKPSLRKLREGYRSLQERWGTAPADPVVGMESGK